MLSNCSNVGDNKKLKLSSTKDFVFNLIEQQVQQETNNHQQQTSTSKLNEYNNSELNYY